MRVILPALLALAVACGGGGGGSTAPQPALSLSVTPATLTVIQGLSGTVQVTVERPNGESGALALTLSGQPSGATGTGSIAAGSTVGTLALAVSSGTVPATYPVTLGASDGSVTGTTAFTLVVAQRQTALWTFNPADPVALFAVQDGTGPWTAVAGAGGAYTFPLAQASGAVACVWNDTASGLATVALAFGSRSDLASRDLRTPASAGLTVTGSYQDLPPGDVADLYLGTGTSSPWDGSAEVSGASGGVWGMDFVDTGLQDLLAVLSNAGGTPAHMVIHRGLDVQAAGDLGTAGLVDFTAEGVDLAPQTLTVTGLTLPSGGLMTAAEYYQTDNGTAFLASGALTATLPIVVLPPGQAADDRHLFAVETGLDDGTGAIDPANNEAFWTWYHAPGDVTVAAPAAMAVPAASAAAGTPYVLVRTRWTFDANYNQTFAATFAQGSALAWTLSVTPGYMGSAVDVTFPDLSSLPGWQASWGLVKGTAVTTTFQGNGQNGAAWPPADGSLACQSIQSGSFTP
jgi:hypothetical protein